MNTVIFDLDGTITDPAEGITRSINHALVELGHTPHPERDLQKYIGPHLNITFSELMILSDDVLATRPTVMIGGRDTDFRPAAAVGMPSIGVRWGYGTDDELAMATHVVETPSELPEAIERTAQPTNSLDSETAVPKDGPPTQ
jgi:phosphoglycolate phosphatase-like HAD superfamily hydrolase